MLNSSAIPVSRFISNPVKFTQSVLYGRNDYSPDAKKIINEIENVPIIKLTIVRTPLSKILTTSMNIVTFGKFLQNNPYDKLFHLAIYITCSKGTYSLEKNEVITLTKNPNLTSNSQTMNVPLNQSLTLSTLLRNTKNYMGSNFFPYDAKTNNCQDFIKSILMSNHLDTNENINFTKQDTNSIFRGLPEFKKFARFLTDIAGRVDVIKQGQGQLSRHNGLTDMDIVNALRGCHKFVGKVYMKDELPNTLEKNKWYVINMENSTDGNGTHWVCFKTSKPMIYFDPLIGGDPPLEILEHAEKTGVEYKMIEIEDVKSTACGFFCIACILSDKGTGSALVHFKRFLARFSKNTKMNDLILHNLLVELDVI